MDICMNPHACHFFLNVNECNNKMQCSNAIMHFIIVIACAKQGSNLRSLGNIGLSDAS